MLHCLRMFHLTTQGTIKCVQWLKKKKKGRQSINNVSVLQHKSLANSIKGQKKLTNKANPHMSWESMCPLVY